MHTLYKALTQVLRTRECRLMEKKKDKNMVLVFKEASEFSTIPSIFLFHSGLAS